MISAVLAGVAGGFYAYVRLSFWRISDVFSPGSTFDALLSVVIGGAGLLFGPVIGSAFLVVLSEDIRKHDGAGSSDHIRPPFHSRRAFPAQRTDEWSHVVGLRASRPKACGRDTERREPAGPDRSALAEGLEREKE